MKAVFAAALLILVSAPSPSARGAEAPASPRWALSDAQGNTLAFPAEDQALTVLLFWASWCPYCRQLMPHLQSVIDEHGDAVRVLAINVFEDDAVDPGEYLSERGYQFTLLPSGDEIAPLYGVRGTPGLFLVNGEGQIVWDHSDAQAQASRLAGINENWQKAARLAPYWAAELRQAIDQQLNGQIAIPAAEVGAEAEEPGLRN